MSYKSRSVYGGRNDDSSYSPDKKDIGLARSLGHQSPNATHGQILSIQGRQYKAYNKDPENDKVQFERYFSKEHDQNQKQQDQIGAMQKQIDALKKQGSAAPAQPKPKGDQQIDAVEHSPEISAARQVANSYQAGLNQKSPWEQATANAESSTGFDQNQTDFTSQYNPSGAGDLPDGMERKDPQQFADKYKLDLIKSGATNNGFS
jgi:hypothetical protein